MKKIYAIVLAFFYSVLAWKQLLCLQTECQKFQAGDLLPAQSAVRLHLYGLPKYHSDHLTAELSVATNIQRYQTDPIPRFDRLISLDQPG